MNALLSWLQRTGTKQSKLSAATGIDPARINNYANGRKRPSLVNALRIERATNGGVPANSWVGEEETQPIILLPIGGAK